MTIYDPRGNIIRFAREVSPDDLLAVYDEQDAADFAFAEATDAVHQLQRQVKSAKEQDAAELRDLLAAGKEPPKMIDKHEREALAAVVRARLLRDAKQRLANEAAANVASAVRPRLGDIEDMAADQAHELGERYRAALKDASRLRESYVARLADWADVRTERQRVAGDDHYRWKPSIRGEILLGNEPTLLLQGLIDEDAVRHVPRPQRFSTTDEMSGTERHRQWESNARNGVRMDPDSLQPTTTTGFETVDAGRRVASR